MPSMDTSVWILPPVPLFVLSRYSFSSDLSPSSISCSELVIFFLPKWEKMSILYHIYFIKKSC